MTSRRRYREIPRGIRPRTELRTKKPPGSAGPCNSNDPPIVTRYGHLNRVTATEHAVICTFHRLGYPLSLSHLVEINTGLVHPHPCAKRTLVESGKD